MDIKHYPPPTERAIRRSSHRFPAVKLPEPDSIVTPSTKATVRPPKPSKVQS